MRKKVWLRGPCLITLLGGILIRLPVNAEQTGVSSLTLQRVLARVRENNPRLAAARKDIEAAAGNVRQARLPNNPRLVFEGEKMEAGRFGDLSQTENKMGISQEFQLGGKRKLRTQVAQSVQQVRELEYQAVERELLSEARQTRLALSRQLTQTLASMNASLEQIRSYDEALLPGARQALELATRGYQAGETSQLEVLQAQQTLAETSLNYLEALAEAHSSLAELERLVGQLTPSKE
ncbi:MAG: TolC family protein [Planctomycetes bacterium]|nr:TolC family protein [Planctomycetota bacterium]